MFCWGISVSDSIGSLVLDAKRSIKPVSKDIVVLPKSVTPSRIDANLEGALAALKALTKEDLDKLDNVASEGKQKRFVTPPWGT